MIRQIVSILCLCILSCCSFGQNISVVDSTGMTVHLRHPARRIISLAPNLTEMIFDLGAGQQIIGVSQYSDYPSQAKRIPIIATYNDLDLEKIVDLHPDLVIAWRQGNPMSQLAKLKRWGIPVYTASFKRLSDIPKELILIGKLTGHLQKAKQLSGKFRKHYAKLQQKYLTKKRVTVFYQLWNQPLMTLNNRTIVGQIIILCGGKNIFGQTYQVAPHISIASVLQADPTVILIQQHQGWQNRWLHYPQLRAVKEQHLYEINPDLIERYGPRVLNGAEQICHIMNEVRKDGR